MSAILESALDPVRRADCARHDAIQRQIDAVFARQLAVMYGCRTPELELMQWRADEIRACESEMARLRALRDEVAA
jgi:hypothetical protein